MAKKKITKTKEQLFPGFMPGDKVYLKPNSCDKTIEDDDNAGPLWEKLNADYEYEIEISKNVYWKQEDSDTPAGDVILEVVCLVHDEVCGGSGYAIPSYRMMSKKEYLATKKKLPSSKK